MTEETKVPEIYVDGFHVNLMPFTTLFVFGQTKAVLDGSQAPGKPEPAIVLRMSPEFAKVVAVMLLRAVRQHERETHNQINIPQELLANLKIAPEDWSMGPSV